MSIARGMAVILALLGLAACAPAYDGTYGDRYGYSSGLYGGGLYARGIHGDPYDLYYPRGVARVDHGRDAYLDALAAARRQALRDAELLRQQDRARRAERRRDWAERDLDRAERDHWHAYWLDRSPVRTGPYDRADFERRRAQFEENRARRDRERADRQAERARDRLDRLDRADRIQDRIDRIERMQRRQETRRAPRQIGGVERQMSESRENYENRARRVIESRRQGESAGALVRDHE